MAVRIETVLMMMVSWKRWWRKPFVSGADKKALAAVMVVQIVVFAVTIAVVAAAVRVGDVDLLILVLVEEVVVVRW